MHPRKTRSPVPNNSARKMEILSTVADFIPAEDNGGKDDLMLSNNVSAWLSPLLVYFR